MKANNKRPLIILVVLIILLAGVATAYFILRKKDKTPAATPDSEPTDNQPAVSGVLQMGSRGDDVKRLQAFLNKQLAILVWRDMPLCDGEQITRLAEDGIFGKKTLAVVKWYFNSTTVNVNQIP